MSTQTSTDPTHTSYLQTQISGLSTQIYNNFDPHNPKLYLDRGRLYKSLGFHDLAAADAYRALTLLECVAEPDSAEYVARRRRRADEDHGDEKDGDEEEEDEFIEITDSEYQAMIGETYLLLVQSLARCGCLRDTYEFQARAIEHLLSLKEDAKDQEIGNNFEKIISQLKEVDARLSVPAERSASLPTQGYARRVLYPWNEHEPDRKAAETLSLLNKRLETVAPDLEVRAVALPALHGGDDLDAAGRLANEDEEEKVSYQLGLFAKRDLKPGEIVLRESSLLTATNRLHDDLCDACNGPLPDLSGNADTAAVACQECDDTIFCSQKCHDQAQETYHAAICGQEGLDSIGKDVADPKDKADYLYFLLLVRAIAMAATQDVNPLDLPEIKYIWGDFHDYHEDDKENDDNAKEDDATLPFSFQLNILQPMRLLEEMGLDPFTTLDRYDTWILNTMYAKFRGTASGRLSTWDGGPEVCAVHPLWCLANHSCDPNVRWEWGGEICFMVRKKDEKAVWSRKQGGDQHNKEKNSTNDEDPIIRKDEEILNHYCDIGLDVKERREWAKGALGGLCQCERCKWEAAN